MTTPVSSIAEFDRLIAEAAKAPSETERINTLCKHHLAMDVGRLSSLDPFSAEYMAEIRGVYSSLSGVKEYNPWQNEQSPYLGIASQPGIYERGESAVLGDFFAAAGSILVTMAAKRGDAILEYGAGEGQISLALARMGCDVHIIDIERRYLDIVERQAAEVGVSIKTKQGVFGDDFGGIKFDHILFYEAFHHALDHQKVLKKIRGLLKPGGKVIFAGEPIIDPDGAWVATVPYPWGPRMDGLSVAAMRHYGWCELGFQRGYFIEALMRAGYLVTFHPCKTTNRGDCYVATVNDGQLDLSLPYVLGNWQGKNGWHEAESGGRWTTGPAVIPLPAGKSLKITAANYLPIGRVVTFSGRKIAFAPGETQELIAPHDGECLQIEVEPVKINSVIPGSRDDRAVGIYLQRITQLEPLR